MTAASTTVPRWSRARFRAGAACALATLAAALAATAATAGTSTQDILGAKIPATVHIKSTGSTGSAKAASTPASTVATTPATSTPASAGAQPGTVAPGSTATATTTTPTTTAPATTTPASTTPASTPTSTTRTGSATVVVAGKTNPKSKRLSAGALALAILGALLVLGALAWAMARWMALEPRWTTSLTYSLREANYRASATWAEFSDWVRLGR